VCTASTRTRPSEQMMLSPCTIRRSKVRHTPLLKTCSVFFFNGSGDTRDLHSLPTRRSSDLLIRRSWVRVPAGSLTYEAQRPALEDRKSTRLNSSHLGSSYAVFCLKKKSHLLRRAVRAKHHAEDRVARWVSLRPSVADRGDCS